MTATRTLNANETMALKILVGLYPIAVQCLKSEARGLSTFPCHKKGRAPRGAKGVLIPGTPRNLRLMAEFVAETEDGWMGAVECTAFRDWLSAAYNTTPEQITGLD